MSVISAPGILEQLEYPCTAGGVSLPSACIAYLKQLGPVIESFVSFQLDSIPANFVQGMCGACPKEELVSAVEALYEAYPVADDITCGGALPQALGTRYQVDIFKVNLLVYVMTE
ncbi:hypothetical protein CYMTET_18674 [Cymbomonas tetramitiformis]|uniref:Uncharacterized protein n=1 Tax=Cymbomonas tetramitiformis TaxID=36881 RepID=A0AAE0G7P7_9CHLO|nr:hypothetical protein CYMTET_18674 [Cymbomonas tetramitiformis]